MSAPTPSVIAAARAAATPTNMRSARGSACHAPTRMTTPQPASAAPIAYHTAKKPDPDQMSMIETP